MEESVDYAENTLDYAENFRLASLAENHIFSCSRNRAASEAESLLAGNELRSFRPMARRFT